MLHLYAITDGARRPLPEILGLGDEPIERAVYRRIAGVYTAHRSPVEVSEEALWRHENVIERLMSARAVLPARFGTSFSDKYELRQALRERYAGFADTLDYVRGRVELGLRVLWNPNESAKRPEHRDAARKPEPGRAYLEARLRDRERARSLADAVHSPLACSAVASRRRLLTTPRLLLTAAYLVENEKMPAFNETLGRVRATHPELGVLCTGPWPPYNFVETPTTDDDREKGQAPRRR